MLAPLDGVVCALIAAGHLDARPATLVDGGLHVDLRFVSGDPSFGVEENLAPVPGGATATVDWRLYINPPTHMAAAVDAACAASVHLVRGEAPAVIDSESAARAVQWEIDADSLRRINGAP
ncbi:hypothetical protein [Cellulomonas biazotea]|uniref:hypothetical protein n=1 Tax=Cellulomonas biazotea TaxID=1709 RepID=UPI001030727D|nr:hypothetical protein [Cellulomonas biazotea]